MMRNRTHWPNDGQAANPANALQAQIGQLRRTLGPAAILTTEAGYALAAGPDEVDVGTQAMAAGALAIERGAATGQIAAARGWRCSNGMGTSASSS
jgi:DNA-binding SARP family transcriptional activator